jgi:hypothetical protein
MEHPTSLGTATLSSTLVRFAADGWTECLLCGAGRDVPAAQSYERVRQHECPAVARLPEAAGLAYLRIRGIGLPTSAKGRP